MLVLSADPYRAAKLIVAIQCEDADGARGSPFSWWGSIYLPFHKPRPPPQKTYRCSLRRCISTAPRCIPRPNIVLRRLMPGGGSSTTVNIKTKRGSGGCPTAHPTMIKSSPAEKCTKCPRSMRDRADQSRVFSSI
jgi:hypothetical protein